MRSFWSDPYLWVHLAGIAAFPIFLEICFLGLAVGDPILPVPVELFFVGAIGIAPILWMQWQRPFSIFSLVAFALKPSQLTDDQRRLLTLFKTVGNQILATIAAVGMMLLLWQLYRLAPIASGIAPFPPEARFLGLTLAAIALLASHLFLQVPLSVVKVLLTREAKFAATPPYPVERIGQDFTLFGLQVKRILPAIAPDAPKSAMPKSDVPKPPVTPVESTDLVSSEVESQPAVEPIAPQPLESIPSEVEPIASSVSEVESQFPSDAIVSEVEVVTAVSSELLEDEAIETVEIETVEIETVEISPEPVLSSEQSPELDSAIDNGASESDLTAETESPSDSAIGS